MSSIVKEYEKKKNTVIDCYATYLELRGNEIDPAIKLDSLEERIKNLKENKFKLAIVGEVKAGKSTFINALLGEEILPTGALQCSSAIVEIVDSGDERPSLKVKFANGKEEKYIDINKYLMEFAVVPEKFRHIPFVQLNDFLINVKGKYREEKLDEFINPILSKPNLNLRNIPKEKYKRLIIEYLNDYKELDKIPIEINLSYPLKYAKEIRLLDTPGVNAIGGIQDKTLHYINQANALLFIFPLKAGIESEAFHHFFNKVIPDKSKNNLFLILTKIMLIGNIERNKLFREVKNIYNKIDEKKILPVDSLYKIVSDDIDKYSGIEELITYYTNERTKYENLYNSSGNGIHEDNAILYEQKLAVLSSIGDNADKEKVKSSIVEKSNFELMEEAIKDFSFEAIFNELNKIVDTIKNGYNNLMGKYHENINLIKLKTKNPQQFEDMINKIQERLREYQSELIEFTGNLDDKFKGRTGSFPKEIKIINEKYEKEIRQSISAQEIQGKGYDFENALQQFCNNILKDIEKTYNDEMDRLSIKYKEKEAQQVNLPKLDLEQIKAEAIKKAIEEKKEYETDNKTTAIGAGIGTTVGAGVGAFVGSFFGGIGSVPGFAIGAGIGTTVGGIIGTYTGFVGGTTERSTQSINNEKYIENIRTDIITFFKNFNDELEKFFNNFMNDYKDLFEKSLNNVIEQRCEELDKLKKKKKENEKLFQDIDKLNKKKDDIEKELSYISNISGNL